MFNYFSENCALCETTLKNIIMPGRLQMKIWSMRVERWISKDANTRSKYVIFNVFSAAAMAQSRVNVTLFIYCL